jgi:transposase-like protein
MKTSPPPTPPPVPVQRLQELRCPNPDCSHFGKAKAEGGKFWLNHRAGKENVAIYRCGHCRKYFSERRGTPLFRSHLRSDEVAKIVEHLHEGCGIRRTARLTRHTTDTVSRYAHVAGLHAKAIHKQLVCNLKPSELQADEKWAFVGKKREPLHGGRQAGRARRHVGR